jgi:hypothetical protein
MSFSSTIQVIKVEKEERTARSGDAYEHFAARCILLDDNGNVETVGMLSSRVITPELRDKVTLGTFRATFALLVPDWGKEAGKITAMLTGLVPAPPAGKQPLQQPAPAKA